MDPTVRFAEQIAAGAPRLDEIAFAIAAHAHAHLDVEEQLARLDELAATSPARTAGQLCRWLSADLGFRGNAGEYYDPRNSFLDSVLDRRLGIPITLSLVAIEVGRRLDIGLVPIGMPGHFLIRESADPSSFFDPYSGAGALDLDDCRERFEAIHGVNATFDLEHLAVVTNTAVVERVLANLHRIYLQRSDRTALSWVLRLRVLVSGGDVSLRRQLAGVLAAGGIFWEAADELEALACLQPERADDHLAAAARLRARAN